MKNDEALEQTVLHGSVEHQNFFIVPTNRKAAVSGAVMRRKQHILFLPKINVFDPLVHIIVRLWVSNVPV